MRRELILLAGCASALHEPPPLYALAPHTANGRDAAALVADADHAWQRRDAARAQGDYLDAAVADPTRVDALIGAMRAITWRIEHERGVDKGALAAHGVEIGQWCQRRAPANVECDYRLAIALGQQARERASTGEDAMKRMVALLGHANQLQPALDGGGPHRVLAYLYLKAPAWPAGVGDPDAAIDEARAAVALAPTLAENYLVLGHTLAADHADEAHAAFQRAIELATAARDPDDRFTIDDATRALQR